MHNSDSAALAAQVAMNTILAGDIGELTKGVNQDISLMWEGKLFGYFGIAGKRKQKGGQMGSAHQCINTDRYCVVSFCICAYY